MTTFESCYLIVDRQLADDHRHVLDFIDADFFSVGKVLLLYFCNGLYPGIPTLFLTIILILEKYYIFLPLMIPLVQYLRAVRNVIERIAESDFNQLSD